MGYLVALLVNNLQQSEEKILTYESEICHLRHDMVRMERSLQDDINSLTMKNSILKSLLEAINQHETPVPTQTDDGEALMTQHINHLPHELQVHLIPPPNTLGKTQPGHH